MRDISGRRSTMPNRRNEADLVILELVRLVREEPWSARRAARRLLEKRYSAGALWLARARVLHAQGQRDSIVADRAARTLRQALTDLETTAGPPRRSLRPPLTPAPRSVPRLAQ